MKHEERKYHMQYTSPAGLNPGMMQLWFMHNIYLTTTETTTENKCSHSFHVWMLRMLVSIQTEDYSDVFDVTSHNPLEFTFIVKWISWKLKLQISFGLKKKNPVHYKST